MGNKLIFSDRSKYAKFDGGLGGGLLALTSVIAIIFAVICYYFCFKKSINGCHIECKREQYSQESCCEKCKSYYNECIKFLTSLESLHNILGTIFSNITQFFTINTENKTTSKLLIISDRESPTGCIGYMTYAYYTYMMVMSFMWFIATALEFSIY